MRDDFGGVPVGRIRQNQRHARRRALLEEKIPTSVLLGDSVIDEVAGDDLVAGAADRIDDGATAGERLPHAVRRSRLLN